MGARLPRLEYFIYFPSRGGLWTTVAAGTGGAAATEVLNCKKHALYASRVLKVSDKAQARAFFCVD